LNKLTLAAFVLPLLLLGVQPAFAIAPQDIIKMEVVDVNATGAPTVASNVIGNTVLLGYSVGGATAGEVALYDSSDTNGAASELFAEASHVADGEQPIMFPGGRKITNGVAVGGENADNYVTLFYE
jgi:hypothetical protein